MNVAENMSQISSESFKFAFMLALPIAGSSKAFLSALSVGDEQVFFCDFLNMFEHLYFNINFGVVRFNHLNTITCESIRRTATRSQSLFLSHALATGFRHLRENYLVDHLE